MTFVRKPPYINKILYGDCIDMMKRLPSESIDVMVTDPPYGYSFMGKEWDKAVPRVRIWKECLRVLKSGAFSFIMCAPRLDCLSHMATNLDEAGFDIGFTPIYWAYASGFPKATNVSMIIDKRACKKKLIKKLGRDPTSKEFDMSWKHYRKIIGYKRVNDIRGDNYERAQGKNVTLPVLGGPVSQRAKLLDGSYGGFQPKPAVEVIIVAMKPLSTGSYVSQAVANQKGVTWLDDARIPFESQNDKEKAKIGFKGSILPPEKGWNENDVDRTPYNPEKGRFPANLLVSDDVLNNGMTTESTIRTVSTTELTNEDYRKAEIYGKYHENLSERGVADFGSFSRYFDLDKWFAKTFNDLPENVRKTFPFMLSPKASRSERDKGCEMEFDNTDKYHGKFPNSKADRNLNKHPTVKPLELMTYLITLGSRPKDIVLDPFVGSGTTCLASSYLNRWYVGIDINLKYVKIARARLTLIATRLRHVL